MSPDGDGGHLSIGEVLAMLQDEFPDTTVSKIRFLESQGLIDPERTPSGYRKFYDSDVERLRWILGQQRDHFLPLKVIKDRLEEDGELPAPDGATPPEPVEPAPEPVQPAPQPVKAKARARAAKPEPSAAKPEPRAPERSPELPPQPSSDAGRRLLTLALDYDAGRPGSGTDSEPAPERTYDRNALARAAGITDEQLDELERYGLVVPIPDDGLRPTFDADALAAAQACAGFFAQGVEARHLKMYLNFTAREADLFRQVLLPHLRQRNPAARERATTMFEELVRDARSLRGALLRRAVHETLGE